jgi:hypothetical protein
MHQNTMLDELLADPMIKLVMSRDGVDAEELRELVTHKAQRSAQSIPELRLSADEVPAAHVISEVCRMRLLLGSRGA